MSCALSTAKLRSFSGFQPDFYLHAQSGSAGQRQCRQEQEYCGNRRLQENPLGTAADKQGLVQTHVQRLSEDKTHDQGATGTFTLSIM